MDLNLQNFDQIQLPTKNIHKESVFKAGEDPDLYLDTNIDEAMIKESKLIRSPVIQKKDGEIVYHKFFTDESQSVNASSSPEGHVDVAMNPSGFEVTQ